MPIHLGPISRRQFLRRSLVAGATLLLSPELRAADAAIDPTSWVLFSDTHLAADRALKVRGVNMTDHFSAARRELLRLPKRPAGLFINGDCAYNTGQPDDYRLLAELLEPIRSEGIPVHLAVGNHDERANLAAVFPGAEAAKPEVAGKRVSLLRASHVNWLMLDSLEKTQVTPGLLGREQLDWLALTLDANPQEPAVVLVHHNPGLNGGNMGLKDTLAFMEIIRPRRQVKAYIYGHTHTWKVERDTSGLHLINLPAVAYAFRADESTGWVHAVLGRTGMRLQLHCIDSAHKLNGQTLDLKWRA